MRAAVDTLLQVSSIRVVHFMNEIDISNWTQTQSIYISNTKLIVEKLKPNFEFRDWCDFMGQLE